MCNLLLSQIYLHKMKQNIGNAVNEFLIFPAESTLHQPEKKQDLSINRCAGCKMVSLSIKRPNKINLDQNQWWASSLLFYIVAINMGSTDRNFDGFIDNRLNMLKNNIRTKLKAWWTDIPTGLSSKSVMKMKKKMSRLLWKCSDSGNICSWVRNCRRDIAANRSCLQNKTR